MHGHGRSCQSVELFVVLPVMCCFLLILDSRGCHVFTKIAFSLESVSSSYYYSYSFKLKLTNL